MEQNNQKKKNLKLFNIFSLFFFFSLLDLVSCTSVGRHCAFDEFTKGPRKTQDNNSLKEPRII